MSFLKPDPPQPPNPLATAAAQTGTNVSTAIANAYLNSTNQITPTGSLTYDQTSTFGYTDPTTGQTFQIPRFTATQSLSPNQQTLQNANELAKINLANLSADESQRMQALFGGGINVTEGGYDRGDINLLKFLPPAATTFGDAGNITTDYNADNQQRDRVEQSLFERMQPQLDRQRAQLEQQLADQGIRYGSPAYTAAMDNFNRQLTDTRLGIIAQGGQEQKLQADLAAQRAMFGNAAQMQQFQQAATRGQFANQGLAAQFAQQQAIINAQNDRRTRYLQEQYALRNQPINEISALLSQGQVSQPQWVSTPTTQIPTTDIAGLINQNFAQQFQNYQTQQQAQSQLLGGILGAGGRIGAAYLQSDRTTKENLHRIGSVLATEPDDSTELPIYSYSYKDDPARRRHVGPMAQDVEKVDPQSVVTHRGKKYVNAETMGSILRAA